MAADKCKRRDLSGLSHPKPRLSLAYRHASVRSPDAECSSFWSPGGKPALNAYGSAGKQPVGPCTNPLRKQGTFGSAILSGTLIFWVLNERLNGNRCLAPSPPPKKKKIAPCPASRLSPVRLNSASEIWTLMSALKPQPRSLGL